MTSLRGARLTTSHWSPMTLMIPILVYVVSGSALTSTPATSNFPNPAQGLALRVLLPVPPSTLTHQRCTRITALSSGL
eukprot:3504046-Prorocentrum_lima.AAC.1